MDVKTATIPIFDRAIDNEGELPPEELTSPPITTNNSQTAEAIKQCLNKDQMSCFLGIILYQKTESSLSLAACLRLLLFQTSNPTIQNNGSVMAVKTATNPILDRATDKEGEPPPEEPTSPPITTNNSQMAEPTKQCNNKDKLPYFLDISSTSLYAGRWEGWVNPFEARKHYSQLQRWFSST